MAPSGGHFMHQTTISFLHLIGNENGDGMDGGVFRKKDWGGGRFSLKFCFQETENQCCETGTLNTDDDNWEQGEVNYFVGYQLGACQNFPLDKKSKSKGTKMDLNEKLALLLQESCLIISLHIQIIKI